MGEPAMIGVIMGLAMGIVAYIKDLGQAGTWSGIFSFAFTLAAMLVIYPTVSGMFVKGLIPISQTMNARMRSGQVKRKFFLIGIDPAVYFGETATLTTGLLLIPILILTALILPGNRTIPLADIPAMPFMAIGAIAVFQGDIVKATITGTIWYSLTHYIASDTAALFTEAATKAGTVLSEGQTFITSWCVSCQPPMYVVFRAFSAEGGMKFVWIAVCVAVYVASLLHFKKHRKAWYKFRGICQRVHGTGGSRQLIHSNKRICGGGVARFRCKNCAHGAPPSESLHHPRERALFVTAAAAPDTFRARRAVCGKQFMR